MNLTDKKTHNCNKNCEKFLSRNLEILDLKVFEKLKKEFKRLFVR